MFFFTGFSLVSLFTFHFIFILLSCTFSLFPLSSALCLNFFNSFPVFFHLQSSLSIFVLSSLFFLVFSPHFTLPCLLFFYVLASFISSVLTSLLSLGHPCLIAAEQLGLSVSLCHHERRTGKWHVRILVSGVRIHVFLSFIFWVIYIKEVQSHHHLLWNSM